MKPSEEMQKIYAMHTPSIDTPFGRRAMTEIGVIKGLEVEDCANYILIPLRKDNSNTTSWAIHRIKTECDVEVEDFGNLEKVK